MRRTLSGVRVGLRHEPGLQRLPSLLTAGGITRRMSCKSDYRNQHDQVGARADTQSRLDRMTSPEVETIVQSSRAREQSRQATRNLAHVARAGEARCADRKAGGTKRPYATAYIGSAPITSGRAGTRRCQLAQGGTGGGVPMVPVVRHLPVSQYRARACRTGAKARLDIINNQRECVIAMTESSARHSQSPSRSCGLSRTTYILRLHSQP
jgi:hypothetical protein